MASVTRRLVFQAARCPARIRTPHTSAQTAQQWQRPLSTTARRCKDSKEAMDSPNAKDSKNVPNPEIISKPGEPVLTTVDVAASMDDKTAPAAATSSPKASVPKDATAKDAKDAAPKPRKPQPTKKPKAPKPSPEERASALEAAQMKTLMEELEGMDPAKIAEEYRTGKRGLKYYDGIDLRRDEDFEAAPEKGRPGFWAEGEETLGPDEDYYGDDITSHGHGQLEEHRELREYARLIAWELPLLNQLAKPFEIPTAATPFRFRYTSYMGESHPAANKVVVEFSPSDLSLAPLARDKLIKLSGPRYNPSTDIIKMSCELYDTLPQNKRHLGDTISSLLAEAKDSKDTFADVPFDFRHHKEKKRYVWPKEWSLTEERKRYLSERRERVKRVDDERSQNGTLVDGTKVIETALPFLTQPELVAIPVGKGGKLLR